MDLLLEFFRHNTMMNDRLLDACAGLAKDQINGTVEGSYGSLGATLVHVANGQDSYVARFLRSVRPERLTEDPFPGFETLRPRFATSNALLEQAAESVSGAGTVEVSDDDAMATLHMPAALLLLQAINHATEHRSQIATMLTQSGVEPPSMDGWTFFFDAGHMTEVENPGQ